MLVTPDQRAALVILDFYDGQQTIELADQVFALVEPFRARGVDVWVAGEPVFRQLLAPSASASPTGSVSRRPSARVSRKPAP